MAYVPQTWADLPNQTTPIDATRLTYIENGIVAARNQTPSTTATLTPAATPLVSGTIYQNLTGGPLTIMQALTGTTAGTSQIALGSSATPPAYGGAETILLASVKNVTFVLPDNWYCSITAASSTFGTLNIIGY